ncbi:GTP-binding protein [Sphaerisporangium perillae]|uniref:GTP-binding protein n=1 Tax=Sphaerisporangium perillae TaxID=2935860 RepID=UPI00200FD37B|nr:GTP-binding protein [Sphaerisporangium perillae]
MHVLNIGILAHVDAGKTSLTERLLFHTGAIERLGSVDSGSTQTDRGAIERQRGITIRTAVAPFIIGDLQVNLIDTPGHSDFIAEVERALGVLDGAVLVLSAVEGIQAQTRVLTRVLHRMRLPTLILVNKIDRAGAREHEVLADIRRRLSPHAIAMNTVEGIGTPAVRTRPLPIERAAEALAEQDDRLLADLVDGRAPAPGLLRDRLRAQTAAGQAHPVFFGSAIGGQGMAELIDGITGLLPAAPHAGGAPRGTVFAVERAENGQKVAYLRLFAGELHPRRPLTLHRPDGEHTGRVTALQTVGATPAITKVWGLPGVRVGDRVGASAGLSERPRFARPTLETLVRPRRGAEAARLHAALVTLADQDPLIQTRTVPGEGVSVLLYGEVQKEVIAQTLRDDFGVEAVFEESRLVCLERPRGSAEAVTEIDRRGPNEFYATVGLRVEPGTGVTYRREVDLGSLPLAFHRAIEESVHEALQRGLYGWQVADCAVTLTRGGFVAPLSTAGDFRTVTPLVVHRALREAGTTVFEPCHAFELEVPHESLSAAATLLAGLGARLSDTSAVRETWLIRGEIPARSVPEAARRIRGLSHGEGVWWSQPHGDRPVTGPPPHRHSPEHPDRTSDALP